LSNWIFYARIVLTIDVGGESSFERLFSFYVKTEYQLLLPSKENAALVIEDAKRIIKVISSRASIPYR